MPQSMLPFFPEGVTNITPYLGFEKSEDGQVVYFNGHMPVFTHAIDDKASFKMITAQFCVTGNAKQSEIAKAFGVTKISVKRAVKLYRDQGPKGFFVRRKTRGAAVLTASVLAQAQDLFDDGWQTGEVAEQLSIKKGTLAKAVLAGRLRTLKKRTLASP